MTEPVSPGAFAKALIEQRERVRRRKLILWGSVGGAVILVAALVIVSFFTPAFATKQVAVSGQSLLTEGQVLDAARVEMGVPLPRQDRGAIAARVRELAPVQDVRVELGWPTTLEIDVTERKLAYQLQRNAGHFDWVDESGAVFHSTAKAEPGAVVATVEETDDETRLLRDVATVVNALPEAIRSDVQTVKAKAVDQITLSLSEKRTVVWGSAEESTLKAEVLAALLSVEARTYDVSAPQLPTTK
ncbi:MAG TPA: FtsQ-type POTRA domain-containing protein [Tessaracoccus flavescens]|uniref:FtsQ-type POTRA domain-containing protein n=1 Tax=Tessaracoccus flavescens TaxID=399497 RepID=A0A921ERV6_9ACTN|nr:FtsQ-type POTRA domain-containing protein [Tessaracoccus flavescens]